MSTDAPAIESLKPGEGSPDAPDSTGNEWSAWAMRKRLPSELAHRTALRWPADVGEILGMSDVTLKKLRADGDTPRLYGVGRKLYTTHPDLAEWLQAHELASGHRLRPATIPRGTKLTRRPKAIATQEA